MLANSSVTDLYTIPVTDWEEINKRVGNVFQLRNIKDIVARTIPGYPPLLNSSDVWVNNTFDDLISQSREVAAYAETAVINFTELNMAVKKIEGDEVPPSVQHMASDMLTGLLTSTSGLALKVSSSSAQVDTFMKNNQIVDAEMAIHADSLGIFWKPLGNIITAVEHATGKINGAWKALEDDLKIVSAKKVNITIPFIMSLDIDASIVLWEELAEEAGAFPPQAEGMKNYWKA